MAKALFLSGRARVRRGRRRQLGLLAVLLVAVALLAVDRLSAIGLVVHYHRQDWTEALWWAGEIAALCIGPVFAGVMIDRFGERRVVGLGMLAWCGLSAVSALTDSGLEAYVARIPLGLLPGLIAVGAQVAIRRTMPARRLSVAVAVVVVVDYLCRRIGYASYVRLFPIDEAGWRWPLLLFAGLGALIALVWLVAVRGGDERPQDGGGLPSMIRATVGLLGRRDVVIVIVLSCVYVTVFRLVDGTMFRTLYFDHLREGTGGVWPWAPYAIELLSFLAAAAWSGRILGRTRSLVAARRPFVAGGFALAALVGAMPLVAHRGDDIALAGIVAAGLGFSITMELLKVDLAPAGMEGRVIGLILSGALTFGLVVLAPLTGISRTLDHPQATASVAAALSFVGAFASWRLLGAIAVLDREPTWRERVDATFD